MIASVKRGRPATGRKPNVTIRLTPATRDKLVRAAVKNKRSLSIEIEQRLVISLERLAAAEDARATWRDKALDNVVSRLEAYEKHRQENGFQEIYAMRLLKTAEDVGKFWEARCKELQGKLDARSRVAEDVAS
jgi:hypothetical protein